MERVDAAALVTDTVAYEVPVTAAALPLLRAGLEELVFELGLTNLGKSVSFGNTSSQIARTGPG